MDSAVKYGTPISLFEFDSSIHYNNLYLRSTVNNWDEEEEFLDLENEWQIIASDSLITRTEVVIN